MNGFKLNLLHAKVEKLNSLRHPGISFQLLKVITFFFICIASLIILSQRDLTHCRRNGYSIQMIRGLKVGCDSNDNVTCRPSAIVPLRFSTVI